MDIRRLAADDWATLRATRLRALADAPDAFESTLAEEKGRPPGFWRGLAAGSDLAASFIAFSDGGPVGMAACFFPARGGPEPQLAAVWVDPSSRGRGVGRSLVRSALGWAAERGATNVYLWVTETNPEAIALYERCGFEATGERQPLSSNPALHEKRMRGAATGLVPASEKKSRV